ncbi:glycosyltransferase family 2 protein [Steroidobacter agaridevorans]|uniref:glycosyltransferase family 2 protein n=1 Tax=Steroidobacter agaridevorans TaxID=2695856 RepID=UPI00137A345C|nr:glycosyltransferase family 2 protein [Steroidobacter agaridevorans]
MTKRPTCKLSICIATYNRASFIGATLDNIISQAHNDCEIVISDNASTDNTKEVIASYARRFDRLRYFRHDTNLGLDRNFDSAVDLARGEYCWLMSDDDWLKPNAIARVMAVLAGNLSLVVVNMELRDFTMSKIVRSRFIDFESDRNYESGETDRLFVELDNTLWNIGNVIVKRDIWMSRERERYYGSWFIHIGVIFQDHLPGGAFLISEPLINYRLGNTQSASSVWAEIFLHKWPSLVDSLVLSNSAKDIIKSTKPWRNLRTMLCLRSDHGYTLAQYKLWISPRLRSFHERLIPILVAVTPRPLANLFITLAGTIRLTPTLSG